MRDIALVLFFLACVPLMLKRPWLGIVMWVWLSVMNPHRLTWGFAYDLQFAAVTAGVTIIGLMLTKDDRRLPLTPPVVALIGFTLWMCLTSLFPFHPGSGYDMWSRVMKIMLMAFIAMALIHEKKQIEAIVWTIVASLGFFGAKGGVFTLMTGGNYLVWGPAGSFIEGNNEVALAIVMTIPLMRYAQMRMPKRWQKLAMSGVMLLSAFSAIGSHSRGALVAISAMAAFLWWKSRNKFAMAIALAFTAIVVLSFMPAEWFERMHSIETYDQDASALGRINAWKMATNLALDRPLGGGFDIYGFETFGRYAPDPTDVHAAHSIYFQVLGEHGFIGLILFVSVGALTWRAAGESKRKAKGIPGMEWVGPLMDMVKVSMVGYGVGGAFLSLAYFDVPYYVMVIVVATRELVVPAYKAKLAAKPAQSFVRSGQFGVVQLADDGPDAAATKAQPGGEWRRQGAYFRP